MEFIVKKDAEMRLELLVKGADLSIINSLRRIMIAEIPTLAIDIVRISKNTTILTDEMIAHRLGLLPLNYQSLDDEGCKVTFKNKAGIEIEEWCADKLIFENSKVSVAFPDIPICKTAKEQELDLTCIVKRGTGDDHAKWSPVSACFFRTTPDGILLTIESIGVIKPKNILSMAVDILLEKLN